MRALRELLGQAQALGLGLEVGEDLPAYLRQAADAVRLGSEPTPAKAEHRLVVAADIVAVAEGDWLVADLPGADHTLAVRHLAVRLAEAGAQAYDVLRLTEGQTVLVARGTKRPQVAGSVLDLTSASRGWLEAAPTASAVELLAIANAALLGRVQASAAAAQMAGRYLAEVAPLRDGAMERLEAERQAAAEEAAAAREQADALEQQVARLKGELTSRYRREDALRAKLARIEGSRWHRLGRRLARGAGWAKRRLGR
ncbi:MAG: hypothetical protein LBS27_01635 [Bifidobacteriaceae bacterium]|jgi:hypothetical protein|nr:hypothetical protein [Bifidobacteriaceae bacterium]